MKDSSIYKKRGLKMELFTVGPVACHPKVLDEMNKQMFSHRSVEYRELHRELVGRLEDFLEFDEKVFLFPSSGSGVMETSVRNCVEEKMLCCINGAFGERYDEVAESNGVEVEKLETESGKPLTPEILDEKLNQEPDVEAVSITLNETSIGLLNPLDELSEVVNEHDKLLFVDAVSGMGGTDIKAGEWGLDVCFASSQKCFGVPPGLAVASVSEDALEKSNNMDEKGWYFDLKRYEDYDERKSGTHMTPPIPQILALNKRLEMIEEVGKEQHFQNYKERSQMVREGLEDSGLTLYPEEGYESPTVSCVNAPEEMTGIEVYQGMREKGFELAKGYGDLDITTFRIGNMGHVTEEKIKRMLGALSDVV
ncbi:aspartate aminotransferase [candidate division MSBL1 archaeon SCGC-AAA382C18]|uniref:Aspartate aminotransferase n=1 Tax=candidate division MSBL1 archaeon SCGC-AAA382C18 TaxID=1698281 RepID=A0A133VIK6_9EURY|nr:aspartate aminotransferase [candidate division MSBL1 archaeon SCGC-AAA382C18]